MQVLLPSHRASPRQQHLELTIHPDTPQGGLGGTGLFGNGDGLSRGQDRDAALVAIWRSEAVGILVGCSASHAPKHTPRIHAGK